MSRSNSLQNTPLWGGKTTAKHHDTSLAGKLTELLSWSTLYTNRGKFHQRHETQMCCILHQLFIRITCHHLQLLWSTLTGENCWWSNSNCMNSSLKSHLIWPRLLNHCTPSTISQSHEEINITSAANSLLFIHPIELLMTVLTSNMIFMSHSDGLRAK